ncbi:MAG: glycosyltransferase [Bdellovibrionales bacterium]|nr:glycosyltransferase [Bdellovibrionales bacterium]
MERVVIVTRSINDRLFELSGALLDPAVPRIKLTGTDADSYFYAFNDIDAEWIINIDEDAFVMDWPRIMKLLDHMERENIDCCGVPDGGVIDHRFHNPISPNPYFSIHCNRNIRAKFDRAAIDKSTFADDLLPHAPSHLFKKNHRYEFDNFEPYYKYFFWLLRTGSKLLYLDAGAWARDPVASVTFDHERQPLLIHSWYARDFENQRWRFHLAARYAKAVQEKRTRQAVPTYSSARPMITIGIISQNRPAYVADAIESALAQQCEQPFEVLVVDNGSSMPIPASNDERARLIRLEHPTTIGEARNKAVDAMHGDFVVWLDDDDVLLPSALAAHLRVLERNPDADVLYGNLYACDAELQIVKELRYIQRSPLEILRSLVFFSPFPNGGSLLRKSLFERIGLYNTRLVRAEDYELWVRAAAAHAAFVHHDTFLYKYRSHSGNALRGETHPEFADANAYVLEQILSLHSLRSLFPIYNWEAHPANARARALAVLAAVFLKYGKIGRAAELVRESTTVEQTASGIFVEALLHRAGGNFQAAAERLTVLATAQHRELRELFAVVSGRG